MVVFLQFLGPQNLGMQKTRFIDFMSSKDCVVKFTESWIIQRQNFCTPVRQSITSRHRHSFLSIHISRRTRPPLSLRKPGGDISSRKFFEVQISTKCDSQQRFHFPRRLFFHLKTETDLWNVDWRRKIFAERIQHCALSLGITKGWTLSHVPCILLSLFSHKISTHRSVKLICSKTDDPIFAFQVPDIDFRLWKEGNICSNK